MYTNVYSFVQIHRAYSEQYFVEAVLTFPYVGQVKSFKDHEPYVDSGIDATVGMACGGSAGSARLGGGPS